MTNKELNNGALILFALLMAGVLFQQLTEKNYRVSNHRVAEKLDSQDFFPYHELKQVIASGKLEQYVVIDLRDARQYEQGHLPGAINLSFGQLMDSPHRKNIRGNKVLIYSDRECVSTAARVFLLSYGAEQARIIPGNYSLVHQHVLTDFSPSYAFYSEDKASFDFSRFMVTTRSGTNRTAPATPQVPGAEDITPVAGGC